MACADNYSSIKLTTSRNTSHSFQHRKFIPTCGFAEGVELGIGVREQDRRAIEFYYASFFKEHYLVIVVSLGPTGNIETHPVVIDHSAKAVCYSKNCALGKFTGESVRSEKHKCSGLGLVDLFVDTYCLMVRPMSSSVA